MAGHITLVAEVTALPRVHLINICVDDKPLTEGDVFAALVAGNASPQLMVPTGCQQVDDNQFLLDDGLADDHAVHLLPPFSPADI